MKIAGMWGLWKMAEFMIINPDIVVALKKTKSTMRIRATEADFSERKMPKSGSATKRMRITNKLG